MLKAVFPFMAMLTSPFEIMLCINVWERRDEHGGVRSSPRTISLSYQPEAPKVFSKEIESDPTSVKKCCTMFKMVDFPVPLSPNRRSINCQLFQMPNSHLRHMSTNFSTFSPYHCIFKMVSNSGVAVLLKTPGRRGMP